MIPTEIPKNFLDYQRIEILLQFWFTTKIIIPLFDPDHHLLQNERDGERRQLSFATRVRKNLSTGSAAAVFQLRSGVVEKEEEGEGEEESKRALARSPGPACPAAVVTV